MSKSGGVMCVVLFFLSLVSLFTTLGFGFSGRGFNEATLAHYKPDMVMASKGECYKSMIWICGLPLTIKEVYIRPDYPVRLHPSPVRLIRPKLVKMKTHSTGAFMSFDQV